MKIWLYHVNPKKGGWTYDWDLDNPRSLSRSLDKTWSAGIMSRKIAVGDIICIYMKNIPPNIDGVYVIGRVSAVDPSQGTFRWRLDMERSAQSLAAPIPVEVIRRFFPRAYGGYLQHLPPGYSSAWLRILGRGQIVGGRPLVKAQGVPKGKSPPSDPFVSRENGRRGEDHVARLLTVRYPSSKGFRIEHVALTDSGSDHDFAVYQAGRRIRCVEVKTRVGTPGDSVLISERELIFRRANRRIHSIFVVYLRPGGSVRAVVEIGARDSFALRPRQHWLTPGIPWRGGTAG